MEDLFSTSTKAAIVRALAVCIGFAVLEGALAGADVAQQYAAMRLPAYSPPLWAWFLIGIGYYVVCFTVLFRLFRITKTGKHRSAAFTLTVLLMGLNALWNVAFFSGNHQIAFFAIIPYDMAAFSLLITLSRLDRFAAWSFVPYVLYLVYANLWGYGVWRANLEAAV